MRDLPRALGQTTKDTDNLTISPTLYISGETFTILFKSINTSRYNQEVRTHPVPPLVGPRYSTSLSDVWINLAPDSLASQVKFSLESTSTSKGIGSTLIT